MPGTRLSQHEKRLKGKWSNASTSNIQYPYLTEIVVEPDQDVSPLRGISDVHLEFQYPVSVIVGANGAGKSTLLALSALAFSGEDYVPPGRAKPGYTFVDFFAKTQWEKAPNNLHISWSYSKGQSKSIHRRTTKKWMHYETRVPRPVHFVGISRLVDPMESGSYRRAFGTKRKIEAQKSKPEIIPAMAQILNRKYTQVDELSSGRLNLGAVQTAQNDTGYSGFNMGTGESSLIPLLSGLYDTPRGSLVLIEEIELGLHASALKNLGAILVEAALERDLQIIVTSHSEWFIDSLPRESRILVEPIGRRHYVLPSVTTRTAITTLSGVDTPELTLLCEDILAEKILEKALSVQIRKRIKIVPIGSDSSLLNAARAHAQMAPRVPVLVYWDGDVKDSKIRKWLNQSQLAKDGCDQLVEWHRSHQIYDKVNDRFLPPELVIQETILESGEAIETIANNVNVDKESFQELLADCLIGADHHDLFRELANALSLSEDAIQGVIITEYVNQTDWTALASQIERMLDGDTQPFTAPADGQDKENTLEQLTDQALTPAQV